MSYDEALAAQVYQAAKQLGADDKVLLALFEAGIVESGFRNLNYGDRDSLGFLQQRPSQGWPNPTDPATATKSFVTRAKANEGKYATAGQLAQSVQVSAYPAKYDQVESDARALLNKVAGGRFNPTPPADATPADLSLMSLVLPDNVTNMLTEAGKAIHAGLWLFNPSNQLRLAAGVSGAVCILLGVLFLSREVR